MNRIRVNHHDMNYLLITGVWLIVHMLLGYVLLEGCYKINEDILAGWLFLILGTVFIIFLMMMLDKSQALVVWDERQIRIKYHKHTDVINIGEIESLSYTLYRQSCGRYTSRLKLEVKITADGREYTVNDNVEDDVIAYMLKDSNEKIPLVIFYRSISKMRPECDMGFIKYDRWGTL